MLYVYAEKITYKSGGYAYKIKRYFYFLQWKRGDFVIFFIINELPKLFSFVIFKQEEFTRFHLLIFNCFNSIWNFCCAHKEHNIHFELNLLEKCIWVEVHTF